MQLVPSMLKILTIALVGSAVNVLAIQTEVVAQSNRPKHTQRKPKRKKLRRFGGRVPVRLKGGRKGVCDRTVTQPFSAAVPENALSATKTPQFAIWIPDQTTNNPMRAKVRIKQKNRNVMPPMAVKIVDTPRYVTFQVPPAANIQPGQTYRWSFEVTCANSEKDRLYGQFTYEPASEALKSALSRAKTASQQARIYEKNDYVLDALAVLLAAKSDDQMAEKTWNHLLQQWDWQTGETQSQLPSKTNGDQ
ncbi:DUF928 domain-containing protein [filamentous cyanobacterium LEGE 11480]|uniref:DUF928 domain-containing protein n=1 Tax=Romeriopsis navalis LEGE 11480 TaxID=2777977 RepID=A0A928VTZ9_9CYAN|nr:DUF928 domain-containing protein [Romeriopsis navalis]MBE9032560.1 DUF928 domain-containing protein [Romeriopsis navalis LEGE 11480]